MSKDLIFVGSGVGLTNQIKDCIDNVIVLGKAGEEVLMEIDTEYSKEMVIEALPKFPEPFIETNPRGIIPPKYLKSRKKKK